MLMDNRTHSTHTYPLSMAHEGEWVKVINARGGQSMLRRLFAMGIVDGVELEILQRRGHEGIVVRCGETRWALGAGMAHKVLVTTINSPT